LLTLVRKDIAHLSNFIKVYSVKVPHDECGNASGEPEKFEQPQKLELFTFPLHFEEVDEMHAGKVGSEEGFARKFRFYGYVSGPLFGIRIPEAEAEERVRTAVTLVRPGRQSLVEVEEEQIRNAERDKMGGLFKVLFALVFKCH
jgi:hypothetical protein